jgi:hypothetical protein
MGTRARGANGLPELVALGIASVMVSLGDGLIWGHPLLPRGESLNNKPQVTKTRTYSD